MWKQGGSFLQGPTSCHLLNGNGEAGWFILTGSYLLSSLGTGMGKQGGSLSQDPPHVTPKNINAMTGVKYLLALNVTNSNLSGLLQQTYQEGSNLQNNL